MNSYKSVRNMNNENGTDTGNTLRLTYKLQINTQPSTSLIQKKVLFFSYHIPQIPRLGKAST